VVLVGACSLIHGDRHIDSNDYHSTVGGYFTPSGYRIL
jgi:hypothetical protein